MEFNMQNLVKLENLARPRTATFMPKSPTTRPMPATITEDAKIVFYRHPVLEKSSTTILAIMNSYVYYLIEYSYGNIAYSYDHYVDKVNTTNLKYFRLKIRQLGIDKLPARVKERIDADPVSAIYLNTFRKLMHLKPSDYGFEEHLNNCPTWKENVLSMMHDLEFFEKFDIVYIYHENFTYLVQGKPIHLQTRNFIKMCQFLPLHIIIAIIKCIRNDSYKMVIAVNFDNMPLYMFVEIPVYTRQQDLITIPPYGMSVYQRRCCGCSKQEAGSQMQFETCPFCNCMAYCSQKCRLGDKSHTQLCDILLNLQYINKFYPDVLKDPKTAFGKVKKAARQRLIMADRRNSLIDVEISEVTRAIADTTKKLNESSEKLQAVNARLKELGVDVGDSSDEDDDLTLQPTELPPSLKPPPHIHGDNCKCSEILTKSLLSDRPLFCQNTSLPAEARDNINILFNDVRQSADPTKSVADMREYLNALNLHFDYVPRSV